MAGEPGYRFLPWTRRGLAGGIDAPDSPGLPARAHVSVGITVSGAGQAGTEMTLYGPGDVVGVDPRLIVRREPRPNTTDVEPNYLAAIEFDPPDFPWMFTPAAPATGDRLRPWCVLVVVDSRVVDPPHLAGGAPLPVIEIPAAAVPTELVDLEESWAWAHTQVMTAGSGEAALRAELDGAPDRQLSRLLCPRRLQPGRRYAACLVPAFGVGVVRGLGGVPAEDADLTPAWTLAVARDVRLPVYYHWEFATGPEGDFESLARALRPYKSDAAEVGVDALFVGDAGLGMPTLEADDPEATLRQDGALRAPLAESGSLGDVAPALREGLRGALEAVRDGTAGGTEALGPPLYGEWHIDRHSLDGDPPAWFEELNLDPRARVAAGLGAEVVRANQEAFVDTCWQQVGTVLDANEALGRARLALEAAHRLHQRHFDSLPADVLAQVSAPLLARVRHGALSAPAAIATTSLPDATTGVAMRRLTSGQRPIFKRLARRRGEALPASGSARPLLARALAAGRPDVDPARFTPGGLTELDFLARVETPTESGSVDLTPVGVPMAVTADQLELLDRRFAELAAEPKAASPAIALRTDVRVTGVVTGEQLAEVASVSDPTTTAVVDRRALLGELIAASAEQPRSVGFLMTVGARSGAWRADALDVHADGRVVVRSRRPFVGRAVATVPTRIARRSTGALATAIAALPRDTLDRRGRTVPSLTPSGSVSGSGRLVSTGPGSLGSRTTNTVAAPRTDPAVVGRFESAFTATAAAAELSRSEAGPRLVPFELGILRGTVLGETDPRRVVPRRTAARVRIGGVRLDRATPPGLTVAPTFDRIMVAPSIVTPLYEHLAEYDRARLLPGVGGIPDDGITLLETNARFVAAFLAGANHEMNRELLWRRYPTDRRGTPLRRFWDRLDGGNDVPAIHTWTPTGALGSHVRGSAQGQLVLLVRGRLLRRYPNSVVYAWRAAGRKLKDPPGADDLRAPVFSGRFPPDVVFVGFDLTFAEVTEGDGWFFVIQQQPTEPRFGFDETPPESPASPPSWSDATWSDADVVPGRHLTLTGNPLAGVTRDGATFGRDAAHLAAVLLQKPMRVALHGSQLAALR